MTLTHICVKKRDETIEEQYVSYGGFVGCVFPDGSIVEEVIEVRP